MPNFVSFVAFIAELAHGEKLHTQSLTHPAYLMPREPKPKACSSEKHIVHGPYHPRNVSNEDETMCVTNHLVRWIAGQPQSEACIRVLRSELLTDLLQCRHPRHSQVTVLQQDPRAILLGLVDHASSNWTLHIKNFVFHDTACVAWWCNG